MPNRLKDLVMESLEGIGEVYDPDGFPIQTVYPYCSNFDQLAAAMKTDDRPQGISRGQVSRLLSNKKRKLRPEQKEVFFHQVSTIAPMSEKAFDELLVLDRNDPEEIEESESIDKSLSALHAAVVEMNEKQERMMEFASSQVLNMKKIVEVMESQSKALDGFRRQSDQYRETLGHLSELKAIADKFSGAFGEYVTEEEWEQTQADRHDWDDRD